MFPIPEVDMESVSVKKFYRYFLTQNAPLHIKDGCQHWPAVESWTDKYYLADATGQTLMQPTQIISKPSEGNVFLFDEKDAKLSGLMNLRSFLLERESLKTSVFIPDDKS